MKLKITKKGKIVLFVILGIIVLGSGGFLLWRVLQEDTVAPGDSDAGGNDTGSCVSSCNCNVCQSTSGYSLPDSDGLCSEGETKVSSCTEFNKLSDVDCYRHDCGHGNWIYSLIQSASEACKDCSWDDDDPSGECDSGSSCPTCRWPNVAFCDNNQNDGTCICKRWDTFDNPSCNYGNSFSCNATCPSGQIECSSGETGCTEVRENCICPECDNKTYDIVMCKTPQEPVNECEGGSWADRPSGEYPYGTDLNPITINTSDKDGLGDVTIIVNGTNIELCGSSILVTCYRKDVEDIHLYLDGDIRKFNITPGVYNINVSWTDGEGKGGDDCKLNTSFTITEPEGPICWESCTTGPEDNCPTNLTCQGGKCVNSACPTESDCTCPNQPQCWESCTSSDDCPTDLTCQGGRCVNSACPTESDCICPEEQDPYCGDSILQVGEQCEEGFGEEEVQTGIVQCTWDECESCICPEEQENPDWTIVKTATGECIVEEEVTYAKATYTITVTNVGEGEGSIDKIIDELDDKVLESYLYDISGIGEYASGVITWDLQGDEEIFQPGESEIFTYYIKVPEESFGIFDNRVTAYPTEGDNFTDDESIDLECDIPEEGDEVPQTGLFDTVLSKIFAGLVLILLGSNWGSITKLNYTIKDIISDNRVKKFERKVAKKK